MLINAKELDYKVLNDAIRKADGKCTITNCCGQRFIATGMSDKDIIIEGIPGNALGAYLNGAVITVNANAQDAVGDTMNEGTIVIHGNIGDAAGYAMRGGKIYVKGDAGYRAGIHMKAYEDKVPVMVIGGAAGSFLGEYQAGGIIVVLGLETAGTRHTGKLDDENIDDKQLESENIADKQLESENIADKQLESENIADKQLESENIADKQLESENIADKQLESENIADKQFERKSIVGYFPCTGMHGGKMFLRSDCSDVKFPSQVTARLANESDMDEIKEYISEYCLLFGCDIDKVLASPFTVITPDSKNPYKQMYAAN